MRRIPFVSSRSRNCDPDSPGRAFARAETTDKDSPHRLAKIFRRTLALFIVVAIGASAPLVRGQDDLPDEEMEVDPSPAYRSQRVMPAQYDVPPAPNLVEPDLYGIEDDDLGPRLRAMEAQHRQILMRLDNLEPLQQNVRDLSNQVGGLSRKKNGPSGLAGPGGYRPRPPESVISEEAREESSARSSAARSLPNAQDVGNRYLGKVPLSAFLDYGRDGVGFESDDGEFSLKFRALAQMDFLSYGKTVAPSTPFDSGFYLPRSRFYFQGHYTKPVSYMLSFQQSYAQFGFLDVFTNLNLDDRLQFRIGRFKIPYGYEWYKQSAWSFITPERSLFAENFGLNRQVGAMFWGQVLDQKLEYAIGGFDGARNSSQDYNSGKDIVTFLNYKPFIESDSFLQGLGFGGSLAWGIENNLLTPAVLRTNSNATSDIATSTNPVTNATVPFLAFNNGVIEHGPRSLYDSHLTYFYSGISFIGTIDWGSESYQNTTNPANHQVKVPISGYSATIAYLLTGETMNERTMIDPISRFDVRDGKRGYGAWEPYFRYCSIDISNNIFTQNIANGKLWTDHVNMTDLGVNWYLNRGFKVYFDWEHAMFGQPNSYGTGAHAMSNDLFWTRVQFYF